jgi:hypothetical protein
MTKSPKPLRTTIIAPFKKAAQESCPRLILVKSVK